ncbi:MAG: CRISPR-associated protein Csm5 [Thermotogaceae bacterium]|jgi:CRISPR-associated protein Csm5|nr:CRISPR-associated protein Csm5 [Thermotogaceae bacterium]
MSLAKKYKMTLRTLSPVHIGNGEKIPALFFAKINQNEFGRLKENRFFEIFSKSIGTMKRELQKGWGIPILNEVIRNIRLNRSDFLYFCQLDASRFQGEVSEFVHHPNGEFYIPGSSLKGALRIALLFKILEPIKEKLNQKVEKELRDSRRITRRQLARLLRDYVDSYIRNATENKLKINSDYMRAFRFFDSEPTNTKPKIVEMMLFKLSSDNFIKVDSRRRGLLEALPEQVEIKFDVSIDMGIIEMLEREFQKFQSPIPENLDELLKIADEFYRKVLEEEIKFLENYDHRAVTNKVITFYNKLLKNSKKIIHLGYGGGSNAMSLFLLLRDDLKKKIRNVIRDHGNMPAPLSRRYVVFEEHGFIKAAVPFGWCEVEI